MKNLPKLTKFNNSFFKNPMTATPWQLRHGIFTQTFPLKTPTSKSVWSNCISAKERGPTVTAKDALYLLAHGTTFHLKQCSVNTLGYIYKSLK